MSLGETMGIFKSRTHSDSFTPDLSRHVRGLFAHDQASEGSSSAADQPYPDPTSNNANSSGALRTDSPANGGGSIKTPGRSFHHRSVFGSLGIVSVQLPCSPSPYTLIFPLFFHPLVLTRWEPLRSGTVFLSRCSRTVG